MVKKSKPSSEDALKQLLVPRPFVPGPPGTGGLFDLPEPPNWLTPWELQPTIDTAGGYDKPEHIIPGIGHKPDAAADEEEKPWPPIQEFIPDPAPDPEEDPLKPPFLIPTTGPPPPELPPPGLPDILEVPRWPGGYPEGTPTPPPPTTGYIQDRVPDAEAPEDCATQFLLTGRPCGHYGTKIQGSIWAQKNDAARSTYSAFRKRNHFGKTIRIRRGQYPRRNSSQFRQRGRNTVNRNTRYRRRGSRIRRSRRYRRRTDLF